MRVIKVPGITLLGWLFSLSAAAASGFTVDDLRREAYAGDIEAVASGLAEVQRDYLAGDATADDMRALFNAFGTTDRRMIQFIQDWLEADPDAPMPNVARALGLEIAALWLLGDVMPEQRHKDAVKAYSDIMMEGLRRTNEAHARDPDLIPAADLAIRLNTQNSNVQAAVDVVHGVMERRPNWGTVQALLYIAHPGYVGSPALIDRICEHFGPMVPETGYDMTFRCRYIGYISFFHEEMEQWLIDHVDVEDPELTRAQMVIVSNLAPDLEASMEQQRRFRAYVEYPGQADVDLAASYDRSVGRLNGWPPMEAIVMRNRIALAQERLEHDPYNQDLIDLVLTDMVPGEYEPGGTRSHVHISEPLDPDLQMEYARRKLVTSPFDPRLWAEYAMHLSLREGPDHFNSGDLYDENAAYYSDHAPGFLASIMMRRMLQYELVELALAEDLPPEWEAFVAGLDVQGKVLCPFLRAYRLYEGACRGAGRLEQDGCGEMAGQQEAMDRIAQIASGQELCAFTAQAPIRQLYYEPIGLPLYSVPER